MSKEKRPLSQLPWEDTFSFKGVKEVEGTPVEGYVSAEWRHKIVEDLTYLPKNTSNLKQPQQLPWEDTFSFKGVKEIKGTPIKPNISNELGIRMDDNLIMILGEMQAKNDKNTRIPLIIEGNIKALLNVQVLEGTLKQFRELTYNRCTCELTPEEIYQLPAKHITAMASGTNLYFNNDYQPPRQTF